MKKAIYPGTFDPVHNGHLDVIERATALFDELVVAVARSRRKGPLFSLEQRVEMLREATGHNPRVEVISFEGLLVELVRKQNAIAVVRGLRAISDFEYEFQLALINRTLNPDFETLFLLPRSEYIYLASNIIKEIARLKGDVDHLVPPVALHALDECYGSQSDEAPANPTDTA